MFCFKTHSLDRCPVYLPSGRVKSAVVPCSREEQRCEVDGMDDETVNISMYY